MRFEMDHLFVCTERGAPEGDLLVEFGLHEGTPNRHEGQGTANRRFAFLHSMIELLWVEDAVEAQSERTRRTRLWDRWVNRASGSCPFGICVRPIDDSTQNPRLHDVPFPAWAYRPAYLPDPLALHIGEAGVEEPMWGYLGFMQRAGREKDFVEHPIGIRDITGLTLTTRHPLESATAQIMLANGILAARVGQEYLLGVEFDGGRQARMRDFRPHLPMVFRF